MGAIIALGHHEKFDGTGYPNGLHGDDIPLVARIVAVADVFDALVSERPYKHAWPIAEGIEYLKAQRGRHFDPRCVDAFLADISKVEKIVEESATDRSRVARSDGSLHASSRAGRIGGGARLRVEPHDAIRRERRRQHVAHHDDRHARASAPAIVAADASARPARRAGENGSSSSSIAGSRSSARASAIRWRCPPESPMPRSPSVVR